MTTTYRVTNVWATLDWVYTYVLHLKNITFFFQASKYVCIKKIKILKLRHFEFHGYGGLISWLTELSSSQATYHSN